MIMGLTHRREIVHIRKTQSAKGMRQLMGNDLDRFSHLEVRRRGHW